MEIVDLLLVGYAKNSRIEIEDDDWAKVRTEIELSEAFSAESLMGLEKFSHVEVIFYFHRVKPEKIVSGARYPRNNPEWGKTGIFAQRGKNRPNRLGVTIAKVIEVKGKTLVVEGLDAIDGTPILDIKPVFREFLPAEPVEQPRWVEALMKNYWKKVG